MERRHDGEARPVWTRSRDLVTLLGFTAIGLLLFRPVLPSFFLSDDFAVLGKVSEHGFLWVLGGRRRFLRPLVVLSHAIDYALWGRDPFGFHLTNLLLHVAAAFLVFVVTRRLAAAVFGRQRAGFSVAAGPFRRPPAAVESTSPSSPRGTPARPWWSTTQRTARA